MTKMETAPTSEGILVARELSVNTYTTKRTK